MNTIAEYASQKKCTKTNIIKHEIAVRKFLIFSW